MPEGRNDNIEELDGMPRDRAQMDEWREGMIAECAFCNLVGGVPEQCRREDGTAGCPRCGSTMAFYYDLQSGDHSLIDLTRGWRAGQTGRCNRCGLVARVFDDVKRENETASCEMCGDGTFEFIYGLPNSAIRAPAAKSVYEHQIDGMTILLSRRVDIVTLARILEMLRDRQTIAQILNSEDENIQMLLEADRITQHTMGDILRTENARRWATSQPLLYSQEEAQRLNGFKMLRVPLAGRMKIRFPGVRGPVDRWVRPEIFNGLRDGQYLLLFDGHYKAVEAHRMSEEPRFELGRRFFPKCNAMLGRGIIKAWSPTGEEIPLEAQQWGNREESQAEGIGDEAEEDREEENNPPQ